MEDPTEKSFKSAASKKSTKNIKNSLFTMVKEEKDKKDEKPKEKKESKPEPKPKSQDFQKPIMNSSFDTKPQTSNSGFQKPPQTPTGGMGYIMTPGYENNIRNYDSIPQTMYPTGMFDQGTPSRTMNDFSNNQFPPMAMRSPYLQSPSPALRNYSGRMGMETPQAGMSGRAQWRKDNFNLSEMVNLFPLIS